MNRVRNLFTSKPRPSDSADMPSSADSTLRTLAGIVSSGVESLEASYAEKGISFPTLADPFAPTPLDADLAVGMTARTIVAAAYQIIATVRAPPESIQEYATGSYSTAALGLVVDLNIANTLQEAGPQVRRL